MNSRAIVKDAWEPLTHHGEALVAGGRDVDARAEADEPLPDTVSNTIDWAPAVRPPTICMTNSTEPTLETGSSSHQAPWGDRDDAGIAQAASNTAARSSLKPSQNLVAPSPASHWAMSVSVSKETPQLTRVV